MQLPRWCLVLLMLPALVTGPGWSLQLCPHELVGADCCCDAPPQDATGEPTATGCCPAGESDEPAVDTSEPGEACCIELETSGEQAESVPRELSTKRPGVELAGPLLCALSAWTPAARAPARCSLPPGRTPPILRRACAPLPLRI